MLEHFREDFDPSDLPRIRLRPAPAAVQSRPSATANGKAASQNIELSIDFWEALKDALQLTMDQFPQAIRALNEAMDVVYRDFGCDIG